MHGVFVPLITPMFHGGFDEPSMKKLIETLEPFVNGYVPCLSSGEGDAMSDDTWETVMTCVRAHTQKPIIAGIKREAADDILKLADVAHKIGCDAVMIPTIKHDVVEYIRTIHAKIQLSILLYNTESAPILDTELMRILDADELIIGVKDSSLDMTFFRALTDMKKKEELSIGIFQGMENKITQSQECDGYIVALANVEPALCKTFLNAPSETDQKLLTDAWWKYNLGGDWYISLKAMLCERGIIRSAEQIHQSIPA